MRTAITDAPHLCSYRYTVNVSVVVLVTPPPVPVIVMTCVPVGALRATVRVKSDVPEPGAAIGLGLKLPVTPDGMPVADSVTAELNPPEALVVTTAYPLCPRKRYPELGETEMVNVPVPPDEVTVSETVVV